MKLRVADRVEKCDVGDLAGCANTINGIIDALQRAGLMRGQEDGMMRICENCAKAQFVETPAWTEANGAIRHERMVDIYCDEDFPEFEDGECLGFERRKKHDCGTKRDSESVACAEKNV